MCYPYLRRHIMKRKEFICILTALACSIAVFVRFCVDLVHYIQSWSISKSISSDPYILDSYIPPIVSSVIFCILSLLSITALILFLISRRKEIISMFKSAPEEKASKAKQRQARKEFKRQQKIEELQKQLDELKKDD